MYNPKTDFICYAREKYGDALSTCYKCEGVYNCHEDREILGKCSTGVGCTPADSISESRIEYIRLHKDDIQTNQKKEVLIW